MEPIKKRRNSILKKKSSEEDTTIEIKARRISFSGKKSIKEFIAGEEAETIWGTSYEESDDPKVSSSESGLVNVNAKRIQLRSRRIIVEPQQPEQKRRLSSKKKAKVQIAANDKENVYVIPANPSPTEPSAENASTSPSTSLHVIGEVGEVGENVSMLKDTLPASSPPKGLSVAGLPNMFSNTFDFINFSGRINKTISISQSVDVTLNDSEIQMFKFRLPVAPTEISPNTSNILTRSILMTDEDVNGLKLARKQSDDIDAVKDEELRSIDAKKWESGDRSKTIVGEVNASNDNDGRVVAVASNSMEITQMNDFKGSKRKSERIPISLLMDSTLNELNSPLRKKPMHTLYGTSMDVTDNALVKSTQMNTTCRESITIDDSILIDETIASQKSIIQGKQTMHFDSVIINESTLCGSNYTSNQSSSFPNTTASCLAMGHQTGDMSMDLSICDTRHQEPIQTKCQTIHLPQNGQMECTLVEEQQVVNLNKENEETNASNNASRKQRESIYTPADMDEASPLKTSQPPKVNKQKGLTMRQTILSGEKIIEDNPKEIVNPRNFLQTTIATPVNIFEDSIQAPPTDNKGTQSIRKTIHQPVDIPKDESLIQQKNISTRESIYTPSDMVEDSPKSSDTDKSSKVGLKVQRRTIVIAKSIVPDVYKIDDSKTITKSNPPITSNESIMDLEEPTETTSRNTQLQKSVYTPSEIQKESPQPSSQRLKSRQTICMPQDIDESIAGACHTEKLQKTIKTPIEIFEDSLQLPDTAGGPSASRNNRSVEGPKRTKENKSRESIYTPSDMVEDSPQKPQPSNFKTKTRQTILAPENIAEECPISIPSAIIQRKGNKPKHSVFTPTDMIPDSPKSSQPPAQSIFIPEDPSMKVDSKQILQKTITTAIDICEDSMQERPAKKQSKNNRQTIYDNADIEKDNGLTECIKSKSKRQTTYEADITLELALVDSKKSAVDEPLQKPSKLRPPSKVQVFRRQLSSTDLTSKSTLQKTYRKSKSEDNLNQQNQCSSKIPEFKSNLKGRQSIHIPVDMDEDSAEPQHRNDCAPSDIKTVAPKVHHQTIITQEDMQTDSPSTSTDPLVKSKQRQTLYTPIEMLETSIQPAKSVITKSVDVAYDLPSDLPFRKPNKLIVEPSKSSENPYSSPNSLMNKVMQDMGYSMNFQLDFPPPNQLAEQKTSHSRHMYSLKDFEQPSINLFSATQVNNSTRPMEVSKVAINNQETVFLTEGIELENDSIVHDRTSQLCKTSFNQSLMEMSGLAKSLAEQPLPTSLTTSKRQTMHLHQDLDVEEPILTPSVSQKAPSSQTMICEEDLDIESPQLSKIRLHQKHCNDVPESSLRSANQSVMKTAEVVSKQGRKTMHLHEDLEVEGSVSRPNGPFKGPLHSSENIKLGCITMHLHEDLEVEGNVSRQNISFKGPLQSSKNINRQTVHPNDKIDEIENQKEPIQIHKSHRRQTILMDQDLDMSVSEEMQEVVSRASAKKIIPQSTNRQTSHLNENLCVEDGKLPNKRQTILMRQELDMTEAQDKTLKLMSASSSKVYETTCFQQEHQDCAMEQSFDQKQVATQLKTEPKRKTMLLNEDLEYGGNTEALTKSLRGTSKTNDRKTMHINEYNEEPKEEEIDTRRRRQTILMSQDLDLSEVVDESSNRQTTNLGSAVDKLPNKRQTILMRQELDITQTQDKTLKIMPSSSSKVQQNTYNHQEVDMEQSFDHKQESAQQEQLRSSLARATRNIQLEKENTAPNRKTMLLNEDVDCQGHTGLLPKSPLRISNTNNRQTDRENVEDRKNEEKPKEIDIHRRRQTILMNQDLDLSEVVNIQEVSPQAPERISSKFRTDDVPEDVSQRRANRQTIHFDQDLEQSLCLNKDQHFGAKRKTILINQDLDFTMPQESFQSDKQLSLRESQGQDLEKSANQNNFSNETRRNTEVNAYRCHRVVTSETLSKNSVEGTGKRQTIHFANDENYMDESGVSQWKATEDNKQAARRVTIIREEQPIITDDSMLPKSIVQIDSKKEEMNPVQNRPRRVTICEDQPPMELDESLLAPKSTVRKSSFSRTLNFDEIPTTSINASSAKNSLSMSKSRITWQPSVFSEDKESPIYNPKFKPELPMTPEVDRSLAEYLKVEAAVEEQQEEAEIFYDAEDGTDKPSPRQNNHRQTCHIPVSILEESGMQPLSSQTLSQSCKRQTTFSPREMSDESLHPEQSIKITNAANKTNNIPLAITSESHRSAHQNRQTLHFNESINTADVSITWTNPRSAKAQSMKQLLTETTRLLTHLNEMQQNDLDLEVKRSTMFFAGKDDSMEVSCVDVDKSPTNMAECTPTKTKTSRIPQLIGSAKKLECLKKSMEFIQQKLPNIRSPLSRSDAVDHADELMMVDKDETPKRFSASVPKKLEEMPEESFNAVDAAEKPANSPPTAQLDDSFETVDIPRKVVSLVRKTIDQSTQQAVMQKTIDAVRRATTFQQNDTLHIFPNEMEVTANASRKSFFQTDDAPITISDVSTFFSQKLVLNPEPATGTNTPCPTDAMSKAHEPEFKGFPRSSDGADTTHNLADFNKRYVDLSDLESVSNIEKTHLSLVNTIDDASEMVGLASGIQTTPDSVILSPEVAAFDAVVVEKEQLPLKKPNSSVCKKCQCRRLSTTTMNETTIGSFMLEPLPVYEIDLSELEQLKKKPNIFDVGKVWRQKMRESDSFNVSDGSQSMAMADENAEAIQLFLKELAEERLFNAQLKQQMRKEVKVEPSFVHRVRMKIESEPNWLVHELLLLQNTILLTHKRLRTFAIVIHFTPKDPRGVEVTFNDIKFKTNQFHTREWKPIEHVQHYQLLVELPFDLKAICPTSENFFELLEHVDKVAQDVLSTVKQMQSLVLPSPASLMREPTGRICIRKKIRTITPQKYVKHTEFHIEVRNIKKLSFESITMPPLYEFDEKIQLLPVGNDFLRVFLNDPMQFLKT